MSFFYVFGAHDIDYMSQFSPFKADGKADLSEVMDGVKAITGE